MILDIKCKKVNGEKLTKREMESSFGFFLAFALWSIASCFKESDLDKLHSREYAFGPVDPSRRKTSPLREVQRDYTSMAVVLG